IDGHAKVATPGREVPDAMYKLAALYEERARSEAQSAHANRSLEDAIRLYKRITREYPSYPEIAAIYYYLGHALADAGRLPESQQVWRSLVCHNHFEYPVPPHPNHPEKDLVRPLPGDGDEAHWTAWRWRYPTFRSISLQNPETVYTEVYP